MTKKSILLIEDNPSDIALTRRAFEQHRIANDLTVVEDGQEALGFLYGQKQFAGRDPTQVPALILLDLKLPKVDGLEVLRRIRADDRTKFIPVVVLTTSKEERDLVESYRLGANSYVRKPVNFAQFAEAIRELGMYWLVLNEPPPSKG